MKSFILCMVLTLAFAGSALADQHRSRTPNRRYNGRPAPRVRVYPYGPVYVPYYAPYPYQYRYYRPVPVEPGFYFQFSF